MFLTKFKAGDDGGDRSPWGGYWFNPVPMGAGGPVTGDAALQLSAVYACVRVLTDSFSTLPFHMFRVKPNGGKEQIRNHWLYRLFAKRPNDYQNPMEFRSMMMGHLALRGNAFAQIVSNRLGEVTDLHPIHPDRIVIEMLSGVNWRYRVKNKDGTEVVITRQDMFHVKGLSSDGIMGYNPIELQRKMLSTGIAAQDYGMRFFENDATPTGGWIEHPTNFKTDDQKRTWRDSWQEMQGGRNRGKTAVLEFGMKYHAGIAPTQADSQFIETNQYNRSQIASMFRVPPHKIGDLTRSTNNNIEHQGIEFVTDCMMPWATCWEEAIKYTFLDVEDDELCVAFPLLSLLRGDSSARATYINTCVTNGTMTRNEGRLMEDREPIEGLDEPLRMLNMTTESEAEAMADRAASEPVQPAVNPAKDPADARLVALATAGAERVARKESEIAARFKGGALADAYAKHAPFVAAALGISAESAEAYCLAQIEFAQANPGISQADFAEVARCKLERLALLG